jgi:hypothetical protein
MSYVIFRIRRRLELMPKNLFMSSVMLLLVVVRSFTSSHSTNGLSAELFRAEEGLES